jgi:hypothetical protein
MKRGKTDSDQLSNEALTEVKRSAMHLLLGRGAVGFLGAVGHRGEENAVRKNRNGAIGCVLVQFVTVVLPGDCFLFMLAPSNLAIGHLRLISWQLLLRWSRARHN